MKGGLAMEKKTKILIATSVMAAFAVAGIAVGTTTALFTKDTNHNVHITSGSLDVGFYLKSMVIDTLDTETGAIIIDQPVDLSTTAPYKDYYVANKGVDLVAYQGSFAISNFMPSMRCKLSFLVENNSDIAINIKLDGTKSGKFADETEMTPTQLEVLKETCPWTSETEILKNQSAEGDLLIELDKDAGNEYQGSSFDVNASITATQVVAVRN